jgi:hypothetical protein
MPMGMVSVLAFIGKPAIRPDLGGPQNLLPGAEDYAHRLNVEI